MVRVWNIPPTILGMRRLLGQHNEAPIMFSSIIRTRDTGITHAYYNHPQTKRFHEDPGALVAIHDACVATRRFNHSSPILEKHSPLEYMFAFPDGFKVSYPTPTQSETISDLIKLRARNGLIKDRGP